MDKPAREMPIAVVSKSSASDRTRVGAALWLIHVENLTKRRDKRFGVLRAGECGNAVDDKERHAVESSLLSFNFLFEHLFKSFVAFYKPASAAIWVSTYFSRCRDLP